MKVLMISTDRALLGEKVTSGDVIERHRHYARQVEKLDIIVFSLLKSGAKHNLTDSSYLGYQTKSLADNLFCYPTNSSSKFFYVRDSKRIAQTLFKEGKYDLIVCQDPFLTGLAGYFIKRRLNTKQLIHFHGDFWRNPSWLHENPINYLFLLISKFTVKHADALRVVSPLIKNKLVKAGVASHKIKVIPTPVNLEKFKKPDNQIVDKFPQTFLLLAGQGRQFDKIRKFSLELDLSKKVKFLGHLDYQAMVNYYHAADIFVLPSRHESFGKVLLEAASSAKPVVATKTTGALSIVQDKLTGFLVPLNNQKQFIDKVLKLLTNQKLAHQMGNTAYTRVQQNFNYQAGVKNVVQYWREVVIGLKISNSEIK
jgi:glycosyltransferase involved in cell wall biosynthesis